MTTKLLLLCIAFVTSNFAYSQSFTVSELIKIHNYDLDGFDTYVTEKGYKYYKNDDSEYALSSSYVYSLKGSAEAFISTFQYKLKNKKMVSFQTFDSKTYLLLKSEIKNLGFRYLNTETNKGSTFLNYSKGNIEITLASSTQNNGTITSYEISVAKI